MERRLKMNKYKECLISGLGFDFLHDPIVVGYKDKDYYLVVRWRGI